MTPGARSGSSSPDLARRPACSTQSCRGLRGGLGYHVAARPGGRDALLVRGGELTTDRAGKLLALAVEPGDLDGDAVALVVGAPGVERKPEIVDVRSASALAAPGRVWAPVPERRVFGPIASTAEHQSPAAIAAYQNKRPCSGGEEEAFGSRFTRERLQVRNPPRPSPERPATAWISVLRARFASLEIRLVTAMELSASRIVAVPSARAPGRQGSPYRPDKPISEGARRRQEECVRTGRRPPRSGRVDAMDVGATCAQAPRVALHENMGCERLNRRPSLRELRSADSASNQLWIAARRPRHRRDDSRARGICGRIGATGGWREAVRNRGESTTLPADAIRGFRIGAPRARIRCGDRSRSRESRTRGSGSTRGLGRDDVRRRTPRTRLCATRR